MQDIESTHFLTLGITASWQPSQYSGVEENCWSLIWVNWLKFDLNPTKVWKGVECFQMRNKTRGWDYISWWDLSWIVLRKNDYFIEEEKSWNLFEIDQTRICQMQGWFPMHKMSNRCFLQSVDWHLTPSCLYHTHPLQAGFPSSWWQTWLKNVLPSCWTCMLNNLGTQMASY